MRSHGLAALLGVLVMCGVHAPRPTRAAVTLEAVGPASPAVIERALVIHDASKGLEHLIQEFTLPASSRPLGMLLPVPARPTVSKLQSTPFAKLAAASSAAAAAAEGGSGFGSSGPEGLTSGPKPEPTAAGEGEQVGRLTTSVIAASDTKALKKWLAATKLGTDAATDAWLAGYAKRGFYFVAVRVSPTPKPDAFKTVTETLQISFTSALPFFPYAEASDDSNLRMLSVWLLSSHRHVPVARSAGEGQPQWLRPWHEKDASRPSPQELKALLPKSLLALLPPGPEKNAGLVRYREPQLQHFEDQKSARRGYGDVVLVREAPLEGGAPAVADLRRLMNVLDPEVKP
ncbi:MAG TPA: DUF2330 domain-containing protein [Polyangiaceae bacterium]|nr:DUF2330 domain-containing protein [Polyangiaceae bacterium]